MIEPFIRYSPDSPDIGTFDKINDIIKLVNGIDQAQDQQIDNETQLLKTFKTLLGVVDTLQDRVKELEDKNVKIGNDLKGFGKAFAAHAIPLTPPRMPGF